MGGFLIRRLSRGGIDGLRWRNLLVVFTLLWLFLFIATFNFLLLLDGLGGLFFLNRSFGFLLHVFNIVGYFFDELLSFITFDFFGGDFDGLGFF